MIFVARMHRQRLITEYYTPLAVSTLERLRRASLSLRLMVSNRVDRIQYHVFRRPYRQTHLTDYFPRSCRIYVSDRQLRTLKPQIQRTIPDYYNVLKH